MFETIVLEEADGVARLTLNRPERMNGMTNRMLKETHDCLEALAGRRDVRVLVITGAGRGFCPGADLNRTILESFAERVHGARIRTMNVARSASR